jgi:hypothetical protein
MTDKENEKERKKKWDEIVQGKHVKDKKGAPMALGDLKDIKKPDTNSDPLNLKPKQTNVTPAQNPVANQTNTTTPSPFQNLRNWPPKPKNP